jgi:hypothetical protein
MRRRSDGGLFWVRNDAGINVWNSGVETGIAMEEEFLSTYRADNSNLFWVCAIKGCAIPFPHEVGITTDRKRKHVLADFYFTETEPSGPDGPS